MSSLSAARYFPQYPVTQYAKRHRVISGVPPVFSALKTYPPPLRESFGDDVLRAFLQEREVSGDFIAKLSDELWLKKGLIVNSENLWKVGKIADDDVPEPVAGESENGGFLKLKQNSEWLLGETNSVPMNKKMVYKEVLDDGERRKRLNLLKYEALKMELLLLTIGIGTACTGYCLITLSFQAALSYATGVLFSCLYFRLLCKHADDISRDIVPQIFTKRKSRRIGIRSEDLKDAFERSVKGASIALSSPRLTIPVAIYGLWGLSQYFSDDVYNFQLLPAMLGLFAYKAAALVQVYRDNEDLQFIFPDDTGK